MNVEKLDPNVYYYTDLVTEEEKQIVFDALKDENDWVRVYNDGHKYDPDRDRSKPLSVMLAYRKNFDGITKNVELAKIINKACQEATKHYREDKNIVGGNDFPIWQGPNFHIDKHLIGTTYMGHIDSSPIDTECYTVLLYINDDYVGGELSFFLAKDGVDTTVTNGLLSRSANGFYPPDAPENEGMVDFWVKPKAMSIIIFPPAYPYPHAAHEVTKTDKYMIKGFWQVAQSDAVYWSSSPYEGRSADNIKATNPEGFIQDGKEHENIKKGIDIVPQEYKERKI
ncbi:Oxoglutarate/iron-dependent dioxygenase [uncultured Caudovirales phage]|uniref:Oxoglutarate/iron-dependent dioxygenase n=1 Tax=uncultured Caudovirales phage TaxID=2100421 RepID=A0A6J7WKM1_9CAUD|nr:Oxoglutarate/iron-dependent dioxygenase [uncultured Caudovirales phage]